ncbi:hypothetical protein AAULR_06799, partial [Lacticaseibacillus rhamnosus MTCC 5462]
YDNRDNTWRQRMQELEKYSLDDTYIRPFDRENRKLRLKRKICMSFMVIMKPFMAFRCRLNAIKSLH